MCNTLYNEPAQLHNKQGCNAKETTQLVFFSFFFLPKHLKNRQKKIQV